ncbi:hypothetical protein E1A91_D12G047500v1 [Gossypium mustelinum]|uniref:Uncharacterized protein n=2 Tax=Gossypium TaxID=3633 RepID=A0A5J5NTR9_GOSBA|nr:hypothetical protein ES319_D12G047600v1 [Gossypium barbadense]TYI49616.1 hypothetical protein E1A91_D12G047500v1 [Gossypium mustelinum]
MSHSSRQQSNSINQFVSQPRQTNFTRMDEFKQILIFHTLDEIYDQCLIHNILSVTQINISRHGFRTFSFTSPLFIICKTSVEILVFCLTKELITS